MGCLYPRHRVEAPAGARGAFAQFLKEAVQRATE
jgi:hypothetical protein